MKILFVSAVLPYPLHSGGQIRMYNLLKRLGKKHEISLYAFIRSEKEKQYIPQLSFCKKVVTILRGRAWQPKYLFKTIASSYPFLWNTYHNSHMLSLLSDEIAKGRYDLIHIEPGYVWPSLPAEHNIPIVIAEHNIEHEIYSAYAKQFSIPVLRPFMMLDVAKMKQWEKRIWSEATAVVAVSEEDKKVIGEKATVVPNGVDLPAFPFTPGKAHAHPVFLYVGNFKWMENRDTADNIKKNYWPTIRKQYPHATLRIVGQGAPDGPFTSMQEELARADVMLAPIRIGGGTKFKILEAMASGVPVVTSTLGAAGLDKNVLWIADSPRQLDIPAVFADRTKIKNARQQIEGVYNWDIIAKKLDTVWNSLS